MRILAPGSYNPDRANARGFTLIELLVVLVVMGIVLGMAAVQLMPDDSSRVRQAAEQLALLLENAALEARSSGVAMAWVEEKNRYQFFQRDEKGIWQSVDSGSYRARALEEGITIAAVEVDGKPLKPGSRMLLSASSFSSSFDIKMTAGAAAIYVAGDGTGTISVAPDKDVNAPAAK